MSLPINRRKLNRYKPLGIRAPIRNSDQDGVFDVTSKTMDRVRSSLYTLLFTQPGTRLQMPEFGSPIYNLNFEQYSEEEFPVTEKQIKTAVERWVPDARINDLEIFQNENAPNEFTFKISFSLAADPNQTDNIVINVR